MNPATQTTDGFTFHDLFYDFITAMGEDPDEDADVATEVCENLQRFLEDLHNRPMSHLTYSTDPGPASINTLTKIGHRFANLIVHLPKPKWAEVTELLEPHGCLSGLDELLDEAAILVSEPPAGSADKSFIYRLLSTRVEVCYQPAMPADPDSHDTYYLYEADWNQPL